MASGRVRIGISGWRYARWRVPVRRTGTVERATDPDQGADRVHAREPLAVRRQASVTPTVVALRTGSIEQRVDRASIAIVPARTAHVLEAPASATVVVATLLVVSAASIALACILSRLSRVTWT